MTDKVVAEGSIWKVRNIGDMPQGELAMRADAVKATHLSGEIWRLYFSQGETPDEETLALRLDADGAKIVAEPDHLAKVTPTQREVGNG